MGSAIGHYLHVTDIVEIVPTELDNAHEVLSQLESIVSKVGREDPELELFPALVASLTTLLQNVRQQTDFLLRGPENTALVETKTVGRRRLQDSARSDVAVRLRDETIVGDDQAPPSDRAPGGRPGWATKLRYDEVGQVLARIGYGPAVVGEVEAYLRLVDDRERRVSALVGEPRLVEVESVAQSYAASFHRHVLEEVETLGPEALVKLMEPLGGVSEVRSYTKRLRDSSQVIALKTGRTYVYPYFQFDRRKHRVRPVVAEVNRILLANQDPWGAMAWWLSDNPRWGHRRPVDHPDDAVLVALAGALSDDGF